MPSAWPWQDCAHAVGTTPGSIFLLYKLIICSSLIIIFILLANIPLCPSPTREERFYLMIHPICCLFHLSGNPMSLLLPQPLPQPPKMPLL